jgi:HAD superfamily hydrolase (TIGR01509 family)
MRITSQIEIPAHVQALIFDCDGTLVDSMPLHMQAWQAAFNEFNTSCDKDFLFSLRGMKEVEIVKTYNQKFGTRLDPEKVVKSKHRIFLKEIQSVKPIDIIADIARHFYRKKPLAVVSGSLNTIVHEELKIVDLFDLFDVILTADDPFKPKPDPDVFLAAANRLNINAEFCQVFEDGDPGLEAAKRAGMIATDVRLFI